MKRTPQVNVIRRVLGISQIDFAARYHIPIGTLRDWEQGRVAPDQAAHAYLTIIARNPDAVRKALTPPQRQPDVRWQLGERQARPGQSEIAAIGDVRRSIIYTLAGERPSLRKRVNRATKPFSAPACPRQRQVKELPTGRSVPSTSVECSHSVPAAPNLLKLVIAIAVLQLRLKVPTFPLTVAHMMRPTGPI